MSIMTIEEAKAYKTKLTQQMQEKGLDEAKLYENAFDDVADGYGVSGFIKMDNGDDVANSVLLCRNPAFICIIIWKELTEQSQSNWKWPLV